MGNSGKINYKWPCSIAMLNYQRVYHIISSFSYHSLVKRPTSPYAFYAQRPSAWRGASGEGPDRLSEALMEVRSKLSHLASASLRNEAVPFSLACGMRSIVECRSVDGDICYMSIEVLSLYVYTYTLYTYDPTKTHVKSGLINPSRLINPLCSNCFFVI